jgi:cytochrome c-type biogenesis protein CcmH/NrfG
MFAAHGPKEALMRFLLRFVVAVATLLAGSAWSAGGGTDPVHAEPKDPALAAIQAAVARSDWAQARTLARAAIEKDGRNADYHNLYAYAIRKGANPEMDLVFKHYNEALRLDPRHRGAHEYLGEAYLMVGNLAKAREQLKALDNLCFFSCPEFTMLKKAIADYEAKQPK